MEDIILGDYDAILDEMPAEGFLQMTVKPIDMVTYWRRCGAVANFVANFYRNPHNVDALDENLISTIFNELLENAAKYSTKRDSDINITIKLYNTILKMQVQNICNQKNFELLKKSMTKLLNEVDLEEFYIKRMMEKSAVDKDSGIGLLILLKDFPVKVGIKMSALADGTYQVTVQGYYFLREG
jgi:hypothetical protein